MYRVDVIGDERYFNYTIKIQDSNIHSSIKISEEKDEVESASVVCIKQKSYLRFFISDNKKSKPKSETIKNQLKKLKETYGNVCIVSIEKKYLKINNNIWSSLWEERKEVKMEQVQ